MQYIRGENMKKILKIIGIILIICYMAVAFFLTICLLNYNEYNVTEINGNSFVIVRDNDLEPDYQNGDLVIVNKNDNNHINSGDKIFFYNTYQNEISINLGKVINKQIINEKEVTFYMEGNVAISSEYVLGKAETAKVYDGLGKILSVLESKLGFLFIIILPILVLFIYQIYAIILELKRPIDEETAEKN